MFDDEPEDPGKDCPTPESVLEKVINHRKYKPKMFPEDLFQAARYWMAHQEQPDEENERARPVKKHGKVVHWHTPYHDRLVMNLGIFFKLKYIHQLHIIENVEAGIAWRGDPPDAYLKIVAQAEVMKENPKGYADSALDAMKNFRFGGAEENAPPSNTG